jgi:hypothetical protein
MKIHQLLDRDPRQSALANGGQARIRPSGDDRAQTELRAELETFVCDGQYGDALDRILRSFLTQLDRPRQNAAWVSGFFGSGKSHLLKMIGHLWMDTEFDDGTSARSLVRNLPDEIVAQLRELDTEAARIGKPPFAVEGAMPSGASEQVRLTILGFVNLACGLPEKYAPSQFIFWLRERGDLDRVREYVEAKGKDWSRELNNLYADGAIADAILEFDPDFAESKAQARQVLRERFQQPKGDISTAEFLAACRQALAPDGELPLTILVLDEVQQYIGDSTDRAVIITEIAEAIQTQLDSRVMLVASGQSALSGMPLLQRLKDRFVVTAQLSDTDVETVTRKVLLHKKPSSVEAIRTMLGRNAGEVSRQLQGTRLAERAADREVAVEDYPLLPVRRRFWEECFRAVDAAGTQSQLRSQLQILHEALSDVADRELGAIIPADVLYQSISSNLVNTGVLLGELATRIQEQTPLGRRICGVAFLISKLPREQGIDTGVRATATTIADLLVDNLETDSDALRRDVESELESMVSAGTLMKVGEEYRLQTTQGAEWDRAFREQKSALGGRVAEIQAKRDQLFASAVQRIVTNLRPKHGDSKVPRPLTLHARPDAPPEGGDELVVWLRDGTSSSQKDVESEARRRGHEDPVLHVFLPKPGDDLRTRIIEAEAARHVVDTKGIPGESPEAREAYESMRSRQSTAEAARDELIRDLVTSSKVYQGGGNEIYGDSLSAKLESAIDDSLSRLFPRFHEGDHKSWPTVLKRARDGSDEPLKVIGWDRPTEEHPVVDQVLKQIGNGGNGAPIRKALRAAPYGWPQDAIDAALITLHRIGSVRVRASSGQFLAPGQLDQNKISSAEFHPEKIRLGASQKLELRGLYQKLGVRSKGGEEEAKSEEFLEALQALARAAGGEAPLPAPPTNPKLDELRRLDGSERLGALLEAREELESDIENWDKLRKLSETRLPAWRRLERLASHAGNLDAMRDIEPEMNALRENRSLLADTDYVAPLAKKLELALREALREAHTRCKDAFEHSRKELEQSDAWSQLSNEQRESITRNQRLQPLADLDVSDEPRLLSALETRSLQGWSELAEGVPTRFAQARADAARELEPKVQHIPVSSTILRTESDLDEWLGSTRDDLLRRLSDGPIVIG